MKVRQILIGLLAMAVVPFAASQGALQGALGTTSTAETTVTFELVDLVQVGIERNLTLIYDPDNATSDSTGVCVFRRGDSGVTLTITSNNGVGGNFVLLSGADPLPYQVSFEGISVTPGTPVPAIPSNIRLCRSGGAPTFPLILTATVTAADANAAPSGTYTDTIVVLAETI